MIKWTKSMSARSAGEETIIGLGSVFDGTLVTKGSLHINGTFKGTIVAKGNVLIGDEAVLQVDIEAENVSVSAHKKTFSLSRVCCNDR